MPTPTAAVALVWTRGRVSIVRIREQGERAPVWTVHLRGERPIYVATTRADAVRVGDHHHGAELRTDADTMHLLADGQDAR
jgi:hypothetical protein